MPPRSPSSERDSSRWAEAEGHGGLVALEGGPAACHWYFRDDYLGHGPASWRRAGYVETSERRENPNPELRGYGSGVVWRFDPALVPAAAVVVERVASLRPVVCCQQCGGRLLLVRPGRVLCEACRVRGESDAA